MGEELQRPRTRRAEKGNAGGPGDELGKGSQTHVLLDKDVTAEVTEP